MMTARKDTSNSEKENRRTGIDRRQFSYTHHLPERRGGKERRRDNGEEDASDKKK